MNLPLDAIEDLILDPNDPMRCARAMVDRLYTLDDGQRTLRRYRGEFWQWARTHYRSIDNEMINSAIWDFLDKVQRPGKDGKTSPFKPSKTIVANVHDALAAICQLDSFIEAPAWLTKGEHRPASEFIAVANGLLHLPTRKLIDPTPSFFGEWVLDCYSATTVEHRRMARREPLEIAISASFAAVPGTTLHSPSARPSATG